jgi:catechol 2,3-dioxygenase-like lactoylglutathione lyase family enzyme
MTRGLIHVNLNVADLERSVAFYQAAFGFDLVERSEETIERDGARVLVRQAILTTPGAGDLLALTQADGFPVGPGGLNHLGLVLPTDVAVDAAIDAALRAGGSLVRRGERDGNGAHEVYAYVRDPDGYAVEVSTQAVLRARLGR